MVQNNNENTHYEQNDITIKEVILKIQEWWRFLLSQWMIIIIVGTLGGALGLTYAFLKKPVYSAKLSFALEDDKSPGGGLGAAMGLASQFGFDLGGSGGGAFAGDNLLELMKSRTMVEKSLLTPVLINGRYKTLAEVYIDFNKIRKRWTDEPQLKNLHFLPNTPRSAFTLQQDSVLGSFYNAIIKSNLSVDKIEKKLSIITVEVQSKSEIFSKNFAEVIAKTVSDFYVDTKTKKSVQNMNILQRQTDSIKHELNNAIAGVASSYDVNPNANPALAILKVPSQRHQFDVQANTAILTQLTAQLEIAKVSLRKETPLIQIIDKPILPLDKVQPSKSTHLILGFFLASLFASILLIGKKVLVDILK